MCENVAQIGDSSSPTRVQEEEGVDQERANFLTGGPQRVLNFDRPTRADGWSVLGAHLIGGMCFNIDWKLTKAKLQQNVAPQWLALYWNDS